MTRALALCLLAAADAHAGLLPQYGGELVVVAPAAPQVRDPWRAWSPAELVLANALGAPLGAIATAAPATDPRQLRFTPREGALWSDGAAVEAVELARMLEAAHRSAAVALPPMRFRVERGAVVVEMPYPAGDPEAWLALPWLRLVRKGAGGALRVAGSRVEADPGAPAGRALVDRIRFEVKDGRRIEAPADGIVLSRAGAPGRAVFALPRRGGPAAAALAAELPAMNRENVARLFVRAFASVPEDWPLPPPGPKASAPAAPIVIAIDRSEGDLRTVGERIQVLLRDRKLASRLVAEDRDAWATRLQAGDYDLALVALPAAPMLVQAATLARLADGAGAAEAVWKDAATKDRPARELFRDHARRVGALLLYLEGGATVAGARVRGLELSQPWSVDPSNAWLVPAGLAP